MNTRRDSPTPRESFAAIQRVRYTVWSVGLTFMLLITSAQPWMRSDVPTSTETTLSLWDLPASGIRTVSENSVNALGMLMLTLSLALLTALRPVRPLMLGTLLSAILSFLNLMWLHEALPRPHSHLAWSGASVASGSGITAALAEALALTVGVALLALVDSADERDLVQQTSPVSEEASVASPWSPYTTGRLAHAARGFTLAILLLIAGTLPWMRFRHRYEEGTETTKHLSLWDLSDSSISDQMTAAAQVTLTLLIVACLLVLLAAAEPNPIVAACGALSLCLTLTSLGRLLFLSAGLHRRYPAVEMTALPGVIVTIVLLLATATAVAAPTLTRRLRTSAPLPHAGPHPARAV